MINIYALNIRAPMIYRANSDRRNSNRMIVDLNILLLRVDRKIQIGHQEGNSRLEQYYRPNGPNKHV